MNRADGMPESIQSALETGDISIEEDADDQLVRVPITLRGQTLGAMAFRVPKGNQTIGLRQKELMNSVVQRLGLALENKRLFEQSQSQAQRERKANEVGSTLLSTTDIEAVLQLAADNFNEALGAVQTRIYLQPEANSDTEDNTP
jgi:GAF domain-containing protein